MYTGRIVADTMCFCHVAIVRALGFKDLGANITLISLYVANAVHLRQMCLLVAFVLEHLRADFALKRHVVTDTVF